MRIIARTLRAVAALRGARGQGEAMADVVRQPAIATTGYLNVPPRTLAEAEADIAAAERALRRGGA